MSGTLASVYRSRAAVEPPFRRRVEPVVHGRALGGPLEDAELQALEQDGYLRFDALVEAERVARVLDELAILGTRTDLEADPRVVREPHSDDVRSVFEAHRLLPEVTEITRDPRILGIARQILGDDVYVHQSRVNLKPGFAGREFWWHSDFETWHHEDGMPRMQAFSLAVSLTPSLPCNGPLMIVPGSHRQFVGCVGETPDEHWRASLRRQEYGVPSQEAITRLVEAVGRIDVITGPPGSAVAFDCNAMHASAGNLTPFSRIALFVVFNAVSNALGDPLSGTTPRPEHVACRRPHPL